MDATQIKIVLDAGGIDPEIARDLVAGLFFTHGLTGVVTDEPGRTGIFAEGVDNDRPNCVEWAVSGFFPAEAQWQDKENTFCRELFHLAEKAGFFYRLFVSSSRAKDWEQAWKAYFSVIHISDRMVVCPSWETFVAGPSQLVIRLDPGMAFGTGTHATTATCMQLLEKWMPPDSRVLDVGTGSGILLVTAAKLGAAHVDGVDTDPVAVETALANLENNRIDPSRYKVWQNDGLHGMSECSYDVVAANINAETLALLAKDIHTVLKDEGLVIASGIITSKIDQVTSAFEACAFKTEDVQETDGWIAIVARKV